MNKAVLALATLARLSLSINAQVDNDSCVDMEAICTTDTYNFPAVTLQPLIGEPNNFYGCLDSQPNPTWWYLEIDEPGDITMSLTAREDIDYAVSFEASCIVRAGVITDAIIRLCCVEKMIAVDTTNCFRYFILIS